MFYWQGVSDSFHALYKCHDPDVDGDVYDNDDEYLNFCLRRTSDGLDSGEGAGGRYAIQPVLIWGKV